MTALFATLLFATAFAASAWTLYSSIRPQLHRYRALFVPAIPALPMSAPRVTVRRAPPVRPVARSPLRAAA
ncbi:hypothetical protein [Sphingomonas soli]|uniref:hypothetical protein n=1 Tax=Sphingomonas soli TaxID=266127 RepID=UPI0014707195|nr:hypothetical protein [Sphingomonas soli]